MKNEALHRMKTAGKYQKKAIRALFPDKVGRHLDVIEEEVKMMVMEIAADVMKECGKKDTCERETARENASGVKKVDIL